MPKDRRIEGLCSAIFLYVSADKIARRYVISILNSVL